MAATLDPLAAVPPEMANAATAQYVDAATLERTLQALVACQLLTHSAWLREEDRRNERKLAQSLRELSVSISAVQTLLRNERERSR